MAHRSEVVIDNIIIDASLRKFILFIYPFNKLAGEIIVIFLQISEQDKLSKDVCELCESKLELTRQFFEQIYAAHVKLLGLLREDEAEVEEGVSVEEEMVQYMRSFETREVKVSSTEMILSQPMQIVKCEPELPDLHDEAQEVKEPQLRDAKHFLDELLDEYEDTECRDDRVEWGERLSAAKRRALMVPPPLRRCGHCGLEAGTHAENMAHWAAEHPETRVIYRSASHRVSQVSVLLCQV